MNKEISIENLIIGLQNEGTGVRVNFDNESIILADQNIDEVENLLNHNFNMVADHYKLIIENSLKKFDANEIDIISLSIVLHYLYMYNSWRVMYRNQKNKNLEFDEKDFSNAFTHDIIFDKLKTFHPSNWKEKSAVLLDMAPDELEIYYKSRNDFYNK